MDKQNQAGHSTVNNVQANIFQPNKKQRHHAGYADNDYTLFKQICIAEFICSSGPIAMLGTVNKMNFTTEEEKLYILQPFSCTFLYSSVGWLVGPHFLLPLRT